MTRFIEFLTNHWMLSGLWILLLGLLAAYLNSKASKSVSPQQATMLVNKQDGIILDVRERKDFEKGHIADAKHIPFAKLQERIVELDKFKETPVVVVCQLGAQAGEAAKLLEAKGFTQVAKLGGGMSEWHAQTLPVVR